ncbi:MAG: HAD hydrolase family protein [Flavobacteriaceae bacterium]|nr:HAD hydrolase family protein [Flavobacteriaceae bacterium]
MITESELDIRLKSIDTFIFDMDGVLTDGKFIISVGHKMLRMMHTKDGYGLRTAALNNYRIIIITGSTSEESRDRLMDLGIQEVYLNTHHKLEKFKQIKKEQDLKEEQVLYMGDDVPDIPLLQHIGLSCCPADAVQDVQDVVDYISPYNGGTGCVRDVIEKVMRAQNVWKTTLWSQ